jgi:hypothetical protein
LRHQHKRMNAMVLVNINGTVTSLAAGAGRLAPLGDVALQDVMRHLVGRLMQRMRAGAGDAAIALSIQCPTAE